MPIRTETITRANASPIWRGPRDARAGVLLLPSVHGIDQYATAYAHALAEAGLATVIWEPFPGQPPAETREQRAARLAPLTDATSLHEMMWWLDLMASELALTKIATAGFCLGGRYGLLLSAHDKRIAACVSYYPTIETPPLPGQDEDVVALATRIPCPVHMIRAGKDHLTSDEVFRRLQANLQSRAAPTIVQHYPARRPRLHAAHRRGERGGDPPLDAADDRVPEGSVGSLIEASYLRRPEMAVQHAVMHR